MQAEENDSIYLLKIKVIHNQSSKLARRLLSRKAVKRISKTPYKSDSIQKRRVYIPHVPSTKRIPTPNLVKAMRGPPKITIILTPLSSQMHPRK